MIMPALIFLVGALILLVLRKNKAVAQYISLIVAGLGFINVILLKRGAIFTVHLANLKLVLVNADKLSLFVGYIFTFIGFLGLLYGYYLKDIKVQIYALLYIGGALGVVFAGDFITVYLFWEMMAVASAPLIFLSKKEEAYKAGIRYVIMHLIGGALLLGGIILYYMNSGSIAVGPVKEGLAGTLIMIGVGLNTGFILLHTWLPDSYPKAPFAASVFMSVYTTKTAVYMLARTSNGLTFVAYMGAVMAVYGATFALMQSQSRKLLSYHIISQVGYMVAAIGMGGAIGINGGILHLFNHILYKSLLFMGVGAVIFVTGEEDLTKMGGLIKKMPVTTVCMLIAALSISGVPLFSGFTSKALIFEATEIVGGRVIIEILLELAAVGTFLSFSKLLYFGFLRPNPEFAKKAKEVPIVMRIPMITVAGLCVFVGVYPWAIARLLPFPIEGGFYNFARVAGSLQLFIPIVIGFIVFNKVFQPHRRLIKDFDSIYVRGASVFTFFFEASRQLDNAINWFYKTLTYIPSLIAAVFDSLNNFLETTFEELALLTVSIKKPFSAINVFLTDTLFVIFVDFWLFEPTLQMQIKPTDLENKTSSSRTAAKPLNFINSSINKALDYFDSLGNKISKTASIFDHNVVDGTAEQMANVLFSQEAADPLQKVEKKVIDGLVDDAANVLYGNFLSKTARLFDKIIVDGLVNGVAAIIFYFGEKARKVQTGLLQNYALIIVFIISILIFLLSIKGGP